jgi:hypothetical protein
MAIQSPVDATTGFIDPPILHSVLIGQPKSNTDERGTWVSSIYRDDERKTAYCQWEKSL